MALFETPQQVRARIGQQAMGAASQSGGLFGPAYTGISQIGAALGGGLAMMNNPQVKRAQDIQKIKNAFFQGIGPDEFGTKLPEFASALAEGGFTDEALKVAAYAKELKKANWVTAVNPLTGDVTMVDKNKLPQDEGVVTIAPGAKQTRRKEDKLEDFGKYITKSGIVEQENALNEVESLINQSLAEEGEIPGYGQTGMVPTAVLSQRGKDIRTSLARVFNVTLRDRSGAAVTIPELERLKEEFGQGKFKTDEDLIRAMNRYRRIFNKNKKALTAGYSKDIVNTWSENAGFDFTNKGGISRPQTKKRKVGRFTVEEL